MNLTFHQLTEIFNHQVDFTYNLSFQLSYKSFKLFWIAFTISAVIYIEIESHALKSKAVCHCVLSSSLAGQGATALSTVKISQLLAVALMISLFITFQESTASSVA